MNKVVGQRTITVKEEPPQYKLEPSTSFIRYDASGAASHSTFIVGHFRKIGLLDFDLCADYRLGVSMFNGAAWSVEVMHSKRSTITITTNPIYTSYRVRAIDDNDYELARIEVAAVFDGSKGATYLPRGEWNVTDTYIKTAKIIHLVIYNGCCYEPMQASITGGANPLYNVTEENGSNWKSHGRYEVIATRLLLTEEAIIEKATVRSLKTTDGGVEISDDRVMVAGSFATPFDIPTADGDFDLEIKYNIAIDNGIHDRVYSLPNNIKYNGAQIEIINYGVSKFHCGFLLNSQGATISGGSRMEGEQLWIDARSYVELKGALSPYGELFWIVKNEISLR